MRLKPLSVGRYSVVAVMDGDECPAEQFLLDGEESTAAARKGMIIILQRVAELGIDALPHGMVHEASKTHGIYEFIKGPLRLFFFKGKNGQIAVCSSGVRKSGRKADKSAVNRAASQRDEYYKALQSGTLKVEG